jgi:hypothetical protein
MTPIIYAIKYEEKQDIDGYIEYFNTRKTVEEKSYLFEYPCIIDIIDSLKNTDPEQLIGVFSWKFPLKTGMFNKKLKRIITINPGYDVYGLCGQGLKGKYLKMTYQWHPGFEYIFEKLCTKLGLEVKEPKTVIYSNFFIAKYSVYKEYIETIIKPAIKILEEDKELKELVWKNANYISGLPKEELKLRTGLEYYPFHTFVLERLMSLFLEKRNLKVKQIL